MNGGGGGSGSSTTLPPSPLQWGVNVGGAFTHTITLGYSGSGNLNSVSLQVYKNGVLNETLSMSGSGSSYSATWGAGVNNESATYSFRATASKGSLNFDTGIQGSVVVNPL